MIGSASDKLLDNNGLYMRLKLVNSEQTMEITRLKNRIAVLEKELDASTIRCDSFKCVAVNFCYLLCY